MKAVQYIAPFAILAFVGCATRSRPTSLPTASPASPAAVQPARTPVARALDEDPPLPGTPSEGWSGLGVAAPPSTDEHRHHEGADVPAASEHSHHGMAPAAHPSEAVDRGGAVSAATYVCPMHPEVTSDRAGRCPKCGMNLEPKQ